MTQTMSQNPIAYVRYLPEAGQSIKKYADNWDVNEEKIRELQRQIDFLRSDQKGCIALAAMEAAKDWNGEEIRKAKRSAGVS